MAKHADTVTRAVVLLVRNLVITCAICHRCSILGTAKPKWAPRCVSCGEFTDAPCRNDLLWKFATKRRKIEEDAKEEEKDMREDEEARK